MDYKSSIRKSIEAYSEKQASQYKQKEQQKNKKPEEEVRAQIFFWLKHNGFRPLIVEAKAVYSAQEGRYLSGQVEAGTSDILAVSPSGFFVACEVKTKSKRSTLKAHQKQFLLDVIHRGGFACCSDSCQHIVDLYSVWVDCPSKQLLIDDLPILASEKDTGPLFKME